MKGLNFSLCLPPLLFYRPAPILPLNPASPLFKSEAVLPRDVSEKFSSPCTRGFSSASEPAAIRNRFCHIPSPSVTLPSRRPLSWLYRLLREPPRDRFAKDRTVKFVLLGNRWSGKEWESRNVGIILFFLKNESHKTKVFWQRCLAISTFEFLGRCLRPVECPKVWLFIS